MATKSFLSEEQSLWALKSFSKAEELGSWLEEALLKQLAGFPKWREAQPVALGSLSRHEICPKSDIDLLFAGPEDAVRTWMGAAQAAGLKVRGRTPKDSGDWSQGVEVFDVLALLRARALVPEIAPEVEAQRLKLRDKLKVSRVHWREVILKEREERRRRHDSVTSYLEPNLKYGPGGLRDAHQALDLILLFPEVLPKSSSAEALLLSHVRELVHLRRRLQLLGGSDILAAGMQLDMAQNAGFTEIGPWMQQVQVLLAETSFWADWVAELTARRRAPRVKAPTSLAAATELLQKHPDVLHQAIVREALPRLSGEISLGEVWRPGLKEKVAEAFFRSQLICEAIPDLKRLRGYVQHDHYHRFTADQHLLQVSKEVLRAAKRPKILGRLAPLARDLTFDEWDILLWAAIYHDLGKGLGGDHETKGQALVSRDAKRMNWPKARTDGVRWLVEHHLALSQAAFRGRADDQDLWQKLHERGVSGRRLALLTIFTAVDIRGTNPEAWNDWKERLLFEWYEVLSAERTVSYLNLINEAPRGKLAGMVQALDPVVAQAVSRKVLLKDLREVLRTKNSLPPLVHRNRRGEIWLRFHEKEDRPGVFFEVVRRLFAMGLSVRQSSVRSLPGVGVYDWFEVKASRSAEVIRRQLLKPISGDAEVAIPQVKLAEIQIAGSSEREVILSFRGRDQRGVLLAAAKALYDLGLTILWARVHTWGQQIDDVFAVAPHPKLDLLLADLRRQFIFGPETKSVHSPP